MIEDLFSLIICTIILISPLPLCLTTVVHYRHLTAKVSLAYFWLITLSSWSFFQVSLVLVLGSIHQLTLGPIIYAEVGLLVAGVLLYKALKGPPPKFFWQWAISEDEPFSTAEWLLFVILAFTGFFLAERGLTQPITDYDSLWFHLPAIARWYQVGTFTFLDPLGHWIFDHPTANQYPYNWHLLSLLFLFPFREDILVTLPMELAWVMLGLGIYLMALQLGANRLNSLGATCLVLVTPMLLNHVTTLHIDLPLATFFIVGLCFALTYHQRRSPIDLSLCVASIGMLAGIKTPGLIYGAFVILVLIILELQRAIRFQDFEDDWYETVPSWRHPLVMLSGLGAFFWGTFWYIHNSQEIADYATASNPILVASTFLSQLPSVNEPESIWRMITQLQETTLTSQFNAFRLSHWQVLITQAVIRLQIPLLFMLLQCACIPIIFAKKSYTHHRRKSLYLILLLLGTGFLYWNTPYSAALSIDGKLNPMLGFNLRYGFPALAILGVVAAIVSSIFQTARRWILLTCIVSGFVGLVSSLVFDALRIQSFSSEKIIWAGRLINDGAKLPVQIVSLTLEILKAHATTFLLYSFLYIGLIAFVCGICQFRHPWLRWSKTLSLRKHDVAQRIAYGICFSVCIILLSFSFQMKRDLNQSSVYQGIYDAISVYSQPQEKIAYTSSARNYLFYGKHLDRQVLNIFLDLHQTDAWLEQLYNANIKLVAMGPNMALKKIKEVAEITYPRGPLVPLQGHNPKQEVVLFELLKKT